MSLTKFLGYSDVKAKFKQEFSMPQFHLTGKIKSEPLTNHYTHIGLSFDYLMRFYLKKNFPKAITRKWVAEKAIGPDGDKILKRKIKNIINEAKKSYAKYLKNGRMDENVIKTTLLLGQLEPIVRAGVISPNIGKIEVEDIQDLKNLIGLVDPNEFSYQTICLLNPTFGKASGLVGGADADLIIDSTLIDIKTTKFLELKREYLNQIIGYYILSLIGGIDRAPKNWSIKYIGIYFSRHGLIYKVPIDEITSKTDMDKFIEWFKKRASEQSI